jgi:nicotinamide phosphoribosyltransferase
MANLKSLNPMLMTDFYKTIHHLAYIPKLEYLVSYWTPRMTRIEGVDKIVSFGQQAMFKEYLIDMFNENFFNKPWEEIEADYVEFITNTMTAQAADTTELKKLHDLGYLPIRIKSVAEGERVNIKTPMFEVTNTVKGFGWLVNYLETYMSVNIWFPMTTATIAFEYRKVVDYYFDKTVDGGARAAACGDFSMRGMTSPESAMKASAGHLTSFTGTATISAIKWLEYYYNCDSRKEVVGKGVPSTEHSVMSSYGRDGEFECYRHLIEDVFTSGLLSMVSDTYDYWNVITNYLPRLKNSIMNRDGKIIIRGDSGDPVDIICGELRASDYMVVDGLTEEGIKDYFKKYAEEHYDFGGANATWYKVRIGDYLYEVTCEHTWVEGNEEDDGGYYVASVESVDVVKTEITPAMKGTVELLWDIFGGTVNSKGYKVLDPHIGAIYGDSITLDRAKSIYARLEEKGFAVNNCTLGIGSYTYQYNTRDTFSFALKATNSTVDGVERQIFKDPVTDKVKGNNFKKSQRGMCYVYRDGDDILYTDEHTIDELKEEKYADNLLETFFEDGKIVKETSLAEIRERLHKGKF